MQIGGVDVILSKQIERREKRKRDRETYVSRNINQIGTSSQHTDGGHGDIYSNDGCDIDLLADDNKIIGY